MDKSTTDFEMKDEYDFSNAVRNRYAERNARIAAEGKYFTRAFNYEKGEVEISEVEAGTHKILSSKIVKLNEGMEFHAS